MTSGTRVIDIRTATVVRPLPQPLHLGAMTVTRREYSAVEVHTADGLRGKAYCLSREAPMTEIVDRLIAPHVVGRDSADIEAVWDSALRGSAIVGRVGLVRRALGLVDIALWDIAAQRAGVPLWSLLGTGSEPRPAMLVAAYPTPDRSATAVADEVMRHAEQGWPLLKISRSPDAVLMRELLAQLRDRLPERAGVVVDVGFGWHDADEALADLAVWDAPDLAWVEDPLLPEDAEGCARIRAEAGVAVGVGDEVTDPAVLEALMSADALDVLRVDVVALGGVSPALREIDRARRHDLQVSCHVYPEVTVHLGPSVETFDRAPEGNPYDPAPTLVLGGPRFEQGMATPPTAPGLGFELDPSLFGS